MELEKNVWCINPMLWIFCGVTQFVYKKISQFYVVSKKFDKFFRKTQLLVDNQLMKISRNARFFILNDSPKTTQTLNTHFKTNIYYERNTFNKLNGTH